MCGIKFSVVLTLDNHGEKGTCYLSYQFFHIPLRIILGNGEIPDIRKYALYTYSHF